MRSLIFLVAVLVAGALGALALASGTEEPRLPAGEEESTRGEPETTQREPETGPRKAEPARRPAPRIRWRRSAALGQPFAGRLVRGVRLPARGRHFRTWDPVLKRSPNRPWRRYGTDRLVRTVLAVAAAYRRANPDAPPLLVGDLSRPRGGDFGPRFGSIGHMTHQNGLDVDVYYPRRDRRTAAARRVDQVDLRLAQEVVDAFLRAGAHTALVGPNTGLRGPPGRVKPFPNHDDHVHVRIRP